MSVCPGSSPASIPSPSCRLACALLAAGTARGVHRRQSGPRGRHTDSRLAWVGVSQCESVWGSVGQCESVWGGVGRSVWVSVGQCGLVWVDVGRCGPVWAGRCGVWAGGHRPPSVRPQGKHAASGSPPLVSPGRRQRVRPGGAAFDRVFRALLTRLPRPPPPEEPQVLLQRPVTASGRVSAPRDARSRFRLRLHPQRLLDRPLGHSETDSTCRSVTTLEHVSALRHAHGHRPAVPGPLPRHPRP